MRLIELATEAKVSRTKEIYLYFLLGHFSDRLPKDVQTEMRKMAIDQKLLEGKTNKKIKKLLK